MIQISAGIVLLLTITACNQSIDNSQWRGPDRNGIYPESNLLKEWPPGGPDLMWSYEGLGAGHGSAGIGNGKLYVCGMPDTIGVLYAFDLEGKLIWKKQYGLEWYKNYSGARSTPTVVGSHVYFESGHGIIYCYDGDSGNLIWSVDILKKFKASNIEWGMAESLLVTGNTVFCTPGGPDHNLVALNRFNGEILWTSTGNRQPAAYCSPTLVRHNNTKLIVTMTSESIIGVDAQTGDFYWSVEQKQRNKIHANTPLYFNGKILCSSASDPSKHSGTVLIQLSENGKKAEPEWRNRKITNLMSGFILKDGYVFGSPFNRSEWYCFDWKTGELAYETNVLASGVIVFADGLFYCYTHEGEMALVDADQKHFKVISSFRIPLGTDQHWAHPVIHKGRLYIRHGNAIMVYDISGG
jgi:outer membrane protein assembly factor BamB